MDEVDACVGEPDGLAVWTYGCPYLPTQRQCMLNHKAANEAACSRDEDFHLSDGFILLMNAVQKYGILLI